MQKSRSLGVKLPKLPGYSALLITAAIAAASGVGFGLALRINGPKSPGSSFLHTEQSFPRRSDWPVSDTPDSGVTSPQSELIYQK